MRKEVMFFMNLKGRKLNYMLLMLGALMFVMGIIRMIQYPEQFLLIILSVIIGEVGIVYIIIHRSVMYKFSKERRKQAKILNSILRKYTSLDVNDCASCALKQISVVSNSDYQHKEADELEHGMYFGIVGEENELGTRIRTLPIIVEPNMTYAVSRERERIDIRTVNLIAVDMNSYVKDEEAINKWKI